MGKAEFLVLSPLVVMVIGWLTIRSSARVLGVWAWVPWTKVYWAVTGGLVFWGTDFETFRRWMGPRGGSWLWSALPFLLVLPTLSMFVKSWRLLAPMTIWLPWLVFGLINPVFEEWYWRGLLWM
jgi:membrane protease YdiL (CAAX protease family)